MKNKGTLTGQIDNSDLVRYPNGKVQNNDGSNNGTPVNDFTQSDVQEFFYKLLRLAGYTPNGDFDNEVNGYQTVDALFQFISNRNVILNLDFIDATYFSIDRDLGNLIDGESFLIIANSSTNETRTKIRGNDSVEKDITFSNNTTNISYFSPGDYLRGTYEGGNIVLNKLIESGNSPIKCAGTVDGLGSSNGTGFTSVRNSAGSYTITHNIGNKNYSAVVSANGSGSGSLKVASIWDFQDNYITVNTVESVGGTLVDSDFSFSISSFL